VNQDWGRFGEQLAEKYLAKNGFTILNRNWRCRLGEIDLVCQDKNCLVIVEVKTKRGTAYGQPEEMVTWRKKAKLQKLARIYPSELQQRRIDIVAIILTHDGELVSLNYYQAI
jgi:putative endonuclease